MWKDEYVNSKEDKQVVCASIGKPSHSLFLRNS
jgi:hypothetical protein